MKQLYLQLSKMWGSLLTLLTMVFGLHTGILGVEYSQQENEPFIFESLIYSPLPLKPQFQIGMSQENQQKLLFNFNQIALNETAIIEALEKKSFPIIHLVTIFAIIAAYFLVRSTAQDDTESESKVLSKQELQKQSLEALKHLLIATPQVNESATEFFIRLDPALRYYLDCTYDIGAYHATPEEISTKAIPIDENLRKKLIILIESTNKFKFAQQKASEQEIQTATTLIKAILEVRERE